MTGAGGETRTPNIQIRSLICWNSKDKFIFYRCDANALNDHYQVNYDKSIWENWG